MKRKGTGIAIRSFRGHSGRNSNAPGHWKEGGPLHRDLNLFTGDKSLDLCGIQEHVFWWEVSAFQCKVESGIQAS